MRRGRGPPLPARAVGVSTGGNESRRTARGAPRERRARGLPGPWPLARRAPNVGRPPTERRVVPTDLREQLQSTLGSAYTLERELGGGGMARVFVAEETALGRRVVVKVLPPETAAGV